MDNIITAKEATPVKETVKEKMLNILGKFNKTFEIFRETYVTHNNVPSSNKKCVQLLQDYGTELKLLNDNLNTEEAEMHKKILSHFLLYGAYVEVFINIDSVDPSSGTTSTETSEEKAENYREKFTKIMISVMRAISPNTQTNKKRKPKHKLKIINNSKVFYDLETCRQQLRDCVTELKFLKTNEETKMYDELIDEFNGYIKDIEELPWNEDRVFEVLHTLQDSLPGSDPYLQSLHYDAPDTK